MGENKECPYFPMDFDRAVRMRETRDVKLEAVLLWNIGRATKCLGKCISYFTVLNPPKAVGNCFG